MAFLTRSGGAAHPARGRGRLPLDTGLIDTSVRKASFFFPGFANEFSTLFTTTGSPSQACVSVSGYLDILGLGNNVDAFSMACWTKAVGTPGVDDGILNGTSNGATQANGFGLIWTGSDTVKFWVTSEGTAANEAESDTIPTPSDWFHIACTFDRLDGPDTIKIYIDGVEQTDTGTKATVMSAIAGVEFEAGRTGNISTPAANFLDGNVDEVALWDTKLSAAQVSDVYNSGSPPDLILLDSEPNLRLWWRMGDGDTSPTVLDSSANDHQGTLVGSTLPTFVQDTP